MTSIAILAMLTITPAFADNSHLEPYDSSTVNVLHENYPAIDRYYAEMLFYDGIKTDQEKHNAVMINDIFAQTWGWDDLIITEMKDEYFWAKALYTDPIKGDDSGDIELIFLNSDWYEKEYILETVDEFYPNAVISQYEFRDASMKLDSSTTFSQTKTVNTKLKDDYDKQQSMGKITVNKDITTKKIKLEINITHTDHDEMRAWLIGPNGEKVQVLNRPRGIADGEYTHVITLPNGRDMTTFNNDNARGDWEFTIGDYYGGDLGTLNYWKITITGNTPRQSTTPLVPITPPITTLDSHTGDPEIDGVSGENLRSTIAQFLNEHFGTDRFCTHSKDDCVPQTGGTMHANFVIEDGDIGAAHGTITLGGLSTTNGKEGFLIAGHTVDYGRTNVPIYHNISSETGATHNQLGTVIINKSPYSNGYKIADVAFVEYPTQCESTGNDMCYGPSQLVQTVEPMKIFVSPLKERTVIDKAELRDGMTVYWIGAETGITHIGTLKSKVTEKMYLGSTTSYSYILKVTPRIFHPESQGNDSGGPVYTIDALGKAKFVGLISGHDDEDDVNEIHVTPWKNIKRELRLNPLS